MKKILLTFILVLTMVFSVLAQKTKGLIIYPGSDTLQVTFKIPTNLTGTDPYFFELQKSIMYYNAEGNKKKIKPKDASEVQFTIENTLYRMVSRKINFHTYNSVNRELLDSVMFLKLEVNGYMKLFSFSHPDLGAQNRIINYLFQKGDGELKWLNFYKVKKDLLDYMKDCDAAVEMIKKNYTIFGFDVKAVVEKYNEECAKE